MNLFDVCIFAARFQNYISKLTYPLFCDKSMDLVLPRYSGVKVVRSLNRNGGLGRRRMVAVCRMPFFQTASFQSFLALLDEAKEYGNDKDVYQLHLPMTCPFCPLL